MKIKLFGRVCSEGKVHDSPQKTCFTLAKVLFNSVNNWQLKAVYFGRHTVVFKMFSSVWQVFCWQCISVCYTDVLHCLLGFSRRVVLKKVEETYQLLATVTSFQLKNKSALNMRWNNGRIWYCENIKPIHFIVSLNFIFLFALFFFFLHFEIAHGLIRSLILQMHFIVELWLGIWVTWG